MDKCEKKPSNHPLRRGFFNRCPKCGDGKLLRGYLTQNDECSACGEDFSSIRADDAPPWITILITGHIMGFLIHYFATHELISEKGDYALMIGIALLLIALILPRAKSTMIAIIWLTSK
ncbi:MAG: DUF983 domain-containing protein [Micavibrio sp.]|nr:DUF983 domain-containing protein [Micavibrio sp.]